MFALSLLAVIVTIGLALVRAANAPGWWSQYSDLLPPWFQNYLGLEEAATLIRTYEVQFVPGLLQTEAYMRALIRTGRAADRPEDIDRRVALRQQRQDRRPIWLTRRAVYLHLTIVVAVPLFLGLFWWPTLSFTDVALQTGGRLHDHDLRITPRLHRLAAVTIALALLSFFFSLEHGVAEDRVCHPSLRVVRRRKRCCRRQHADRGRGGQ